MKRVTKEELGKYKKLGYTPKKQSQEITSYPQGEKYYNILNQAEYCFNSMYDIRKRARRNMDFYRGRQWGDIVEVNGVRMTEEEYIQAQGKPALKQNLIRPPLRNLLGQFRSNPFKSVVNSANKDDQSAAEMMTVALESANEMNNSKARHARMLEYFLLTGGVIAETCYKFDDKRMRAIPKFKMVSLERFFVDQNIEDTEGEDIRIIGEISDIPMIDLVAAYAKNEQQQEQLQRIYAGVREDQNDRGKTFDEYYYQSLAFKIPSTTGLCRVIKVCVKEARFMLLAHDYADASYEAYEMKDKALLDAENEARKALSLEYGTEVPLIEYKKQFITKWRYYHLSPLGHCLWEGENPYLHNSHPYVFKFYPMINGAVWSFVEDLIDQQKMINRMFILWDFMNSAAAKGVLLFPEELKPDDLSWEDIADEWTRYNGLVRIKAKAGIELPKQIVNSTLNSGVTEMINAQMKLMQDIGGVTDANQGKNFPSGTPASLVHQLASNGALNTLDYLETFSEFIQQIDFKIIQLIKQFYKDKRYQDLGGRNTSPQAKVYNPDIIRNIDFTNTISKGNDTPAYRMVIDDMLWNMLQAQFIDLKMFLEHSSMPFSDKLLSSLKSAQEQMQEIQGAQVPQIQQETPQQV